MKAANLNFDLSLDQKDTLLGLTKGNLATLRGQSGRLHDLTIGFDESGSFSVSGPITIDGDGFMDGVLELRIKDISGLVEEVTKFTPAMAPFWQRAEATLQPLIGEGDGKTIKLTINESQVTLGFFAFI